MSEWICEWQNVHRGPSILKRSFYRYSLFLRLPSPTLRGVCPPPHVRVRNRLLCIRLKEFVKLYFLSPYNLIYTTEQGVSYYMDIPWEYWAFHLEVLCLQCCRVLESWLIITPRRIFINRERNGKLKAWALAPRVRNLNVESPVNALDKTRKGLSTLKEL